MITGAGSKVGAELVANRDVRALSFTGSVAGRPCGARRGDCPQLPCAARARRPQPVHRDGRRRADRAVEAAFAGAFWSAGQKCTATRRILVQDARLRRVPRDSCSRGSQRGKVGDPADPATEVGPVVQRGAVRGDPRRDRARQGRGRHRRSPAASARDDDGVPDRADRVRERRRRRRSSPARRSSARSPRSTASSTLDEALERANAVEFGLSAAIFTRDLHADAALRERARRPGSSTSTRRPPAPTSTSRSAASRTPAWGPHEQGRAAIEFYTETVNRLTGMRRLPERRSRHRRPRLSGRLGRAAAARRRRRVLGYDLGDDPQPASSSCSATTPAASRLVKGRHHRAPRPRARARRAGDHACRPSRRAPGAVRPAPTRRSGMHVNVAGTVNVFDAVSRRLDRIPWPRLRQLGGRLQLVRSLPRPRVRRCCAGDALRRLEAGRRGNRSDLPRGCRVCRRSACGPMSSTGRDAIRG